jgi:hypothetical protein
MQHIAAARRAFPLTSCITQRNGPLDVAMRATSLDVMVSDAPVDVRANDAADTARSRLSGARPMRQCPGRHRRSCKVIGPDLAQRTCRR